MAFKFTSNRSEFTSKSAAFKDMLQARMAMNIEVVIKTSGEMPVKTGGLKSATRHFKSESGGYRVEANKEYAAAQEAGERNGTPFRHYTTPGTGPHWFQHAIDATLRTKEMFIAEAKKAVGL